MSMKCVCVHAHAWGTLARVNNRALLLTLDISNGRGLVIKCVVNVGQKR